ALARRAGAFDSEEALGGAHLAVAAAGAAGLRRRARSGAGARAGLAGDAGRHRDLGVPAVERVLESDLQVVAQVGAALAAGAATRSPAHEVTKQVVEDVGHGTGKIRPEAARTAATAAFE